MADQPSTPERSPRLPFRRMTYWPTVRGLHRAHIGEIERGETNVTVLTLKTLSDSLGVTLSDLVRHA